MTTPATKVLNHWNTRTPADKTQVMTALSQHQESSSALTLTYQWVELRKNKKGELVLTVRVGFEPGEDIGTLLNTILGVPTEWARSEGGLASKIRPAHHAVLEAHDSLTASQFTAVAASLAEGVKGVTSQEVAGVLRVRLVATEDVQLTTEHIRAWMEKAMDEEVEHFLDSPFGGRALAQEVLAYPYSSQWARQQASALLAHYGRTDGVLSA